MTNFLDAALAKCPHCGHEDFTGPSEPQLDHILTCTRCSQSFTLENAISTTVKEALVKELTKDGSFKR